MPLRVPDYEPLVPSADVEHGWRIHRLRDPVESRRLADRLCEWYASQRTGAWPWDVAVFARADFDGTGDFVFSPALCARPPILLYHLQPEACRRPSFAEGFALLVGDKRAVALLAPRAPAA